MKKFEWSNDFESLYLTREVTEQGAIMYRTHDGLMHRDNDLPAAVFRNGGLMWFRDGQQHRDGDKPAVVGRGFGGGTKEWWVNGVRHRDGTKPAVLALNKTEWWHHGVKVDPYPEWVNDDEATQLERWVSKDGAIFYYNSDDGNHRDYDLPAVVQSNGDREWYRNGKRHRDNGKPAVVRAGGRKEWWVDGVIHRDGDQPAIIMENRTKIWCHNGACRRNPTMPVPVTSSGVKRWYVNGEYV